MSEAIDFNAFENSETVQLEPELSVAATMSDFALHISRALATGSDYIVNYGVPAGEPPRRYIKPQVAARYAAPVLRAIE